MAESFTTKLTMPTTAATTMVMGVAYVATVEVIEEVEQAGYLEKESAFDSTSTDSKHQATEQVNSA